MNKICFRCHKDKELSHFYPRLASKDGHVGTCKSCMRIYKKANFSAKGWEYKKNITLKHKFGITLEDYRFMVEKQGGVCAICHAPEKNKDFQTRNPKALAVDHDHKTAAVRALLCDNCNRALGLIHEDFDVALSLARYIQEHQRVI